jgi:hypothetical protein
MITLNQTSLRCDGCGQLASPEHTARRLRRLEWATRYRPVHIQTLLLSAISPPEDADYLYTPGREFRGEAAFLLRAVGISSEGKTAEAVHTEFQGAGFFLTHLLECPLENEQGIVNKGRMGPDATCLLGEHLPAVASRMRRSLKPRRVILVTEVPEQVVQNILALDLGCPVLLNDGRPFGFSPSAEDREIARFRAALESKSTR